jgi:hypothetical protein
MTLPVTSVAPPLLHHTATVFSCLSELAPGYLTITIAIHAVKSSVPSLVLRNDTVAISIQCIETSQNLFGTLSPYLTDFIARYFAIAIGVDSHFRRITTVGHSKLVKTNDAIVVGIHLLDRIFHPLSTLTLVTVTVGHSRHGNSARD